MAILSNFNAQIIQCTISLVILASCGTNPRLPWGSKASDEANSASATPVVPSALPPAVSAGDSLDELSGNVNNATLTNLSSLMQMIQTSRWHESGSHCQNQSIAIFDNGFDGLKESLGTRLPADLKIETYAKPGNSAAASAHGTKLAELIWALCSGSKVYSPTRPGPKLKLYNTNGFSNLQSAVDSVVDSPVDIILYSQVWEFGGNFDGQGFINSLVNKATAKGMLWINASGNYAQATYQSVLSFNSNQEATLPYAGKYVRLVVNEQQSPVKLILAWNDFTNDKNYRSSQDLDLYLGDSDGIKVAESILIQDGAAHPGDAKYSAHAREQILTILKPGIYNLKITSKNPASFNAFSRFRLAASGNVAFIDQTPEQSVMIPADNASVLTVGAYDVDFSSTSKEASGTKHKPEVTAPSIIEFDNGISFAGSSSAAAIAAAGVAIYQSSCGKMPYTKWIDSISQLKFGAKPDGQKEPMFKLPYSGKCL